MRAVSGRLVLRSACVLVLVLACVASSSIANAGQAPVVSFESMVADLSNEKPAVRFRAVQALKQAAYPESAVPLARVLTDEDDAVQLEAIAAELNIFLAEKVVPRKRVGLVVEVRNRISAPDIFQRGATILDPQPVPLDVLTALRAASHDDNARVSAEALYAFGALSDNVYGRDRATLRTASAPELGAALGVPQADVRAAAIRVIGRLYARRPGDPAVDQTVGDALVAALNDREYGIRMAALETLGLLRYERAVQGITDLYAHYERGANAAAALGALAAIGHVSSVPQFAAAVSGRDESLKRAGIEGLARAGDSSNMTAISDALATERSEEVLLAGHYANVRLANGSPDALVDALSRPRVQHAALRYLIDVAPGRVPTLATRLSDSDENVRLGIFEALGLSGDRQAVSIVERLQQDGDPVVARAARRAVLRLGGGSAAQ